MSENYLKLNYNSEYLAYKQLELKSNVNVMFLGGLYSNMFGKKAEFLEDFCRENKVNCTRFDYFGHGKSSGRLEEGNITMWLENAKLIFEKTKRNKNIIVGSSMGGWIAMLLAREFQEQIDGVVMIAPAIDFTKDLLEDLFDDSQKQKLKDNGYLDYTRVDGVDVRVYQKFIDDGSKHLLKNLFVKYNFPIRILQGSEDNIVPVSYCLEQMEKLDSDDISLKIIKGGDHSLSNPQNLRDLGYAVKSLI